MDSGSRPTAVLPDEPATSTAPPIDAAGNPFGDVPGRRRRSFRCRSAHGGARPRGRRRGMGWDRRRRSAAASPSGAASSTFDVAAALGRRRTADRDRRDARLRVVRSDSGGSRASWASRCAFAWLVYAFRYSAGSRLPVGARAVRGARSCGWASRSDSSPASWRGSDRSRSVSRHRSPSPPSSSCSRPSFRGGSPTRSSASCPAAERGDRRTLSPRVRDRLGERGYRAIRARPRAAAARWRAAVLAARRARRIRATACRGGRRAPRCRAAAPRRRRPRQHRRRAQGRSDASFGGTSRTTDVCRERARARGRSAGVAGNGRAASDRRARIVCRPRTRTPSRTRRARSVFGGLALGEGAEGRRLYNSAFLTDETARSSRRYDKRILVPFGEYLPFATRFPWLRQHEPCDRSFHAPERSRRCSTCRRRRPARTAHLLRGRDSGAGA